MRPWRGLALLLISGMLAAPLSAAAQQALDVELEAPEAVRGLLERHVRLLRRSDATMPEAAPDRSAMARRARREVGDLLATEGYFTPTVRIDRSEAGRWVIKVDPGPRTTIAEVTVDFDGEITRAAEQGGDEYLARLRASWSLPPGAPFRQADWDAAKQQMLDSVSARRYAAARMVESRAEVDRSAPLPGSASASTVAPPSISERSRSADYRNCLRTWCSATAACGSASPTTARPCWPSRRGCRTHRISRR